MGPLVKSQQVFNPFFSDSRFCIQIGLGFRLKTESFAAKIQF